MGAGGRRASNTGRFMAGPANSGWAIGLSERCKSPHPDLPPKEGRRETVKLSSYLDMRNIVLTVPPQAGSATALHLIQCSVHLSIVLKPFGYGRGMLLKL